MLITCQTVNFQPTEGWLIETNKYLQHGDQHANIKCVFCVHNHSLEVVLKKALSISLAYFILIECMYFESSVCTAESEVVQKAKVRQMLCYTWNPQSVPHIIHLYSGEEELCNNTGQIHHARSDTLRISDYESNRLSYRTTVFAKC